MKLKKTFSAVTATVLSLSMAFAFTACGGDKDGDTEDAVITAIALNETATVENHSTVNVLSSVTYSDGNSKKTNDSNIVWSSSNESVATVNRGIVSALKVGETNITAKYNDVSSNVCKVTVQPGRIVTIYNADGEAITDLTLDVAVNKTAELTAKVTREGSDTEVEGQEIEWTTADDTTVTVNDEGLVTAIQDTEEDSTVNIVATIKNTEIKATLPVTVTWAGKEDFTFDASTYEQNKSPAGVWNYWGDHNYNWTDTTMALTYVDPTYEENHTADTENDFFYIGANKVTTIFSIVDPTINVAAVQLFYRSAGESEAAKLETNHNYEVKLKIKSSAAGVVSLNDYTQLGYDGNHDPDPRAEVGEIVEDQEYEFEVEANVEKEISVQFRHGDSGAIYQNGVYNNIESAIQLCLGKLGTSNKLITVEVYDIQYKDLGEAENKFYDNAKWLEGYEEPLPEGDWGEEQEAVYTDYNNGGNDLAEKDTWGVWYAASADWNCGNAIDMAVTLDADAKSCQLVYNPNGNINDWGVQLRYMPEGLVEGHYYKVKVNINTTVAYSISLNGKTVELKVGDNEVEFTWLAGKYLLEGNISNANTSEEITLVISNLTWQELIPADAE